MNTLMSKIITFIIVLTIAVGNFGFASVTQADSTLTIDRITINTDFVGNNGTAKADITWHANKPAYGQLRYGLKSDQLDFVANTSGKPLSEYTISLSGLKSETTYYFTIQANINTEATTSFVRSFKTVKVGDSIAPTFETNISRIDTTAHTVTFQWTTDEETSGTVYFGTNKDKLSSSASHSGRSKKHEVVIKNLKPSTTYWYRGQIKDKDNVISNYFVDSFRTLDSNANEKEPLIISSLGPNSTNDSRVHETSLTISFTTNRPTKATITLKSKAVSKTIKTDTFSTTLHSYTIDGLAPNTTYDSTVSVSDNLGHTTKLDKLTFATRNYTKTQDQVITTSANQSYITPAVRLVKSNSSDTVYAVVTPLTAGAVCSAAVTKVTSQAGWNAEYYDWNETSPNMAKDDKAVFNSPLETSWYNPQYLVKTKLDTNLKFGPRFYPVDEFKTDNQAHNYYFGAHWSGNLNVPATGNYAYVLASDDDSWVLIDGQVVINNGGRHRPTEIKKTLNLTAGSHRIDVYYAERYPVGTAMTFYFSDPKLVVTTGQNLLSCPAGQIKTASVKLHAIMNPTAFQRYGYQWNKIEIVSDQELQRFAPAKLIRTANDPTVYYVDTARRLKIAIPNEAVFNSYGNQWNDVVYVVPEDLKAYYNVELIKEAGSPVVYLLQDNTIRPFASLEAMNKRGYNVKQIVTVNSYHLSTFNRGDSIQ